MSDRGKNSPHVMVVHTRKWVKRSNHCYWILRSRWPLSCNSGHAVCCMRIKIFWILMPIIHLCPTSQTWSCKYTIIQQVDIASISHSLRLLCTAPDIRLPLCKIQNCIAALWEATDQSMRKNKKPYITKNSFLRPYQRSI